MHLFIVGWNIPKGFSGITDDNVINSINYIYQIYPQLNKNLQINIVGTTYFIISLQTDQLNSSPRQYISQSDTQTTLFSGSMCDRTGHINPNNANELASNWDKLPDILEGAFVCLQITSESKTLEIITDYLGLERVYSCQIGDAVLISNSITLLKSISGLNSIDSIGLSLFLTIQYTGSKRTLVDGISALAGGRIFRWEEHQSLPKEAIYFSISEYIEKRDYLQPNLERLQSSLIQTCINLNEFVNEINCPLTGGRDSRLITALLRTAGLHVKYYSYGEESGDDIQIAKQIAESLGLDYEFNPISKQDILEQWEDICNKLMNQNDGMVCLWQVQDVLNQQGFIETSPLILPGFGGEVARGYISSPEFYLLGKNNKEYTQNFLFNKIIMKDEGLLRSETINIVRKFCNNFCVNSLEMGFSLVDIPKIYYILEEVPSWIGNNCRKYKPFSNTFSLLLTRAFVDAAFLYSSKELYVEPLHYRLINHMVPELMHIPFTQGTWKFQNSNVYFAKYFLRWPLRKIKTLMKQRYKSLFKENKHQTFNQHSWFEAQLSQIRSICLDNKDSSHLWDCVDRTNLEWILSKKTSSEERRKRIESLYNIFTMAYYCSMNIQ